MKPFKNYYILPAAMDEFRDARKWYASRHVKGLSNRFAHAFKDKERAKGKTPHESLAFISLTVLSFYQDLGWYEKRCK